MEAFREAVERAFMARVIGHLHDYHAKAVVDLHGAALEEEVAQGIARARSFGLTWESTIATFVALRFEVARDFDEHPHIHQILMDESVPPDSRIDLLLQQVSDVDWEEASQGRAATVRSTASPEDDR
jgi:hypothetical protein